MKSEAKSEAAERGATGKGKEKEKEKGTEKAELKAGPKAEVKVGEEAKAEAVKGGQEAAAEGAAVAAQPGAEAKVSGDRLLKEIYKKCSRLAPAGYRKHMQELFRYADMDVDANVVIGFSIFLSIILTIAAVVDLFLASDFPLVITVFLTLLVPIFSQGLFYIYVYFAADGRAHIVDSFLPDALQLTSSHIRAGLTPDKALLAAARPEFGPLEKEIKQVAREMMAGRPLEKAFAGMSTRVKSISLERTMKLIAESMRSGGELATLLEETAEDMRNAEAMRNEIRANVTMYMIFIFIATAIGAPLLFAVSTYLVESVTKLGASVVISPEVAARSPIKLGSAKVSTAFLGKFALLTIATSGFFSGLIIGLIEDGKEKSGVKYIPFLMGIGLLVYYVSNKIISSIFGGMMGG